MLEADLWRSEAKVAALKNPGATAVMTYKRGKYGEILMEEKDEVPKTKEEGMERWKKQMELRFLQGDDEEFDYSQVDSVEEFDYRGVEEREEEERWFDEEEPQWVADGGQDQAKNKQFEGETGIQDY